jgi:hypothetical protein
LWQRKKARKASKQARKYIEELIVGASCRFGLFLLQKVLSVVAHFLWELGVGFLMIRRYCLMRRVEEE